MGDLFIDLLIDPHKSLGVKGIALNHDAVLVIYGRSHKHRALAARPDSAEVPCACGLGHSGGIEILHSIGEQ
jgi:hypothetical protein